MGTKKSKGSKVAEAFDVLGELFELGKDIYDAVKSGNSDRVETVLSGSLKSTIALERERLKTAKAAAETT